MTMFFDPALAEAAQHALSWSPPAVVQPAVLLHQSADFQREVTDALDELDRGLAEWVKDGQRVRTRIREALTGTGADIEVLSSLQVLIRLVEQRAVQTSRETSRLLRRIERQACAITELRPDQRELAEAVVRRVEQAVTRELDERSDFALFLRALAAEHDPDAQDGQTFDDPDTLRKHLNAVIAK